MGYVYLIEDPSIPAYKIGVTRSKTKNRLNKLQTGNATTLTIVGWYETEYPFRLETILHNRYSHYKIKNEWYNLPSEVIQNFNSICDDINRVIICMKDNYFFSKNLK